MSAADAPRRGGDGGGTIDIIALIVEFERRVSHLSFAEVTRGGLTFIRERLALARVSVALVQDDHSFLIFDSTEDVRGLESGTRVPWSAGTLGVAVDRLETSYRRRIPEHTDNVVDQALLAKGLHSAIAVPLRCGGRCIGTLNAAAHAEDGISPTARQAMELLAPRLAFAIHACMTHGQLAESEARFRDVFAHVADGIAVADLASRRIVMANPAMSAMLGRTADEMLGITVADIHPPERLDEVIATFVAMLDGHLAQALEIPMLRSDGTVFLADVAARPTTLSGKPSVVGVFRDAGNRRQREQEQIQVQKLESLRTLAAGIAHDFNNLLTGLIGHMSLVQPSLARDSEAWAMLDEAQRSAFRASGLTRQLLTFAKGGAPVRQAVDLVQVVRDSANLAASGSNVACRFEVPSQPVSVMADEGQLAQVVQNLVRNAVEAMPGGGVANIRIAVGASAPFGQGAEALIEVSDTGKGIEPHLLDRVFVPFFSTKSSGTGLGLAVAYSIVQNHGGRMSVVSQPGLGTTFTIFLPLAEAAGNPPASSDEPPAAGGRVLVMDDQAAVRLVAERALRAAGYLPTLTADGDEAIAAYRDAMAAGQPFIGVILDLTIPGGRGGREVAAGILALDPGARLMVSSGYSDDAVMADYRSHGFRAVLPKPYGAAQLQVALARMLRE